MTTHATARSLCAGSVSPQPSSGGSRTRIGVGLECVEALQLSWLTYTE